MYGAVSDFSVEFFLTARALESAIFIGKDAKIIEVHLQARLSASVERALTNELA